MITEKTDGSAKLINKIWALSYPKRQGFAALLRGCVQNTVTDSLTIT
jgi:hypothetical protein